MRVAFPLFTLGLPWLSGVCRAGSERREERGREEGKGRPYPCEQPRVQVLTLCPGTVAQTTNSKFKELRDMEVSSNWRTSGGQSLTNETSSCVRKQQPECRVHREHSGGTGNCGRVGEPSADV